MGIEIEDGMGFRGLLPSREDAMEERIWKQKKELARLRAENERLKVLLHRWRAAYPATHSVPDGQPLPWMQDTLKELDLPLLKPVRSEEE